MDNSVEQVLSVLHVQIEGFIKRRGWVYFATFFSSTQKKIGRALISLLDRLEVIPILFPLVEGRQLIASQPVDFLSALHLSELFVQHAKKQRSELPAQLLHRIVALRYRLELVNGGSNPVPYDPSTIKELVALALEWKKGQEVLVDKQIVKTEYSKLVEVSRYPLFAALLEKSAPLREAFFIWAFRDKNEPVPFILFPKLYEKLMESNMSGRIGKIGGSMLQIKKQAIGDRATSRKAVTLPFEGKEYNILDENQQVALQGHWNPTVGEVFAIFRNKYRIVGDLEFFAAGITNWNTHLWGYWDAVEQKHCEVDLTQQQWWNRLPIQELLTIEQAQRRYGSHLNGVMWNVAATSSRSTITLNYDGCHSYLELAIPSGTDHYVVYAFGKFAKKYSTSMWENLQFFCHNLHATVAYPDENIFYSHRQHAYHSFPLTPKEGELLLERIRRDIVLGRADNFVYQIESENCAKWLHEHLEGVLGEQVVPNLYRTALLATEPVGIMALLFSCLRALPSYGQVLLLRALHIPFGAKRPTWIVEEGECVPKSLHLHAFWQTAEVFLPAFLHKQQELGILSCVRYACCYLSVTSRLLPSFLRKNRAMAGHFFRCPFRKSLDFSPITGHLKQMSALLLIAFFQFLGVSVRQKCLT